MDKATQPRALSGRRFNTAALHSESQAFACYSGARTAGVEEQPKQWKEAGYVDNAVVLVEDFLSAQEVEHFKNLMLKHVKPVPGDPTHRMAYSGGAQYGGTMLSSHPELDVSLPEDQVLNALEKRIAEVFDIPATNEELHLQMVLNVGRPELLGGAENKLQAIHHDKNSGLTRQATAIVYLNDVEEGGETVFPALPVHPQGPVPRTAVMRSLGRGLKKLIKGQLGSLAPEVPWPTLAVPEDSELYHDMVKACPSAGHHPGSDNSTAPLIVKPVPGRAIFFWHETRRSGNAIFDNFHMGCPVKKGAKMALQKFKHFAKDHEGCKKSKWCHVGTQRAEEFVRVKKAFTT